MNGHRFRVDFLEEAKGFLDEQKEKARNKILYDIWKARSINDKELFKKLRDEIWEFRTKYDGMHYRLFAFWDKEDNNDTVVVSTHGLIKKTDKTPKSEIEHAEHLRKKYFNDKTKNRKK
jgi:phage-related protein